MRTFLEFDRHLVEPLVSLVPPPVERTPDQLAQASAVALTNLMLYYAETTSPINRTGRGALIRASMEEWLDQVAVSGRVLSGMSSLRRDFDTRGLLDHEALNVQASVTVRTHHHPETVVADLDKLTRRWRFNHEVALVCDEWGHLNNPQDLLVHLIDALVIRYRFDKDDRYRPQIVNELIALLKPGEKEPSVESVINYLKGKLESGRMLIDSLPQQNNKTMSYAMVLPDSVE